jgi:surface antigen Omp85-like protein
VESLRNYDTFHAQVAVRRLFGLALLSFVLPSAGPPCSIPTVWANESAEAVDSNTPWEEKAKLKEESTATEIALALPRAIAWPFQQVGNGMEKGLLYVEDNHVLTFLKEFQRGMVEDGIFPIFGGLGDGAGLGGGVLLRRPGGLDPERALSLRVTASVRNFHHHELSYFDRSILGPMSMNLAAAYFYMPQEDFYGLGRESLEEDHTSYRRQTIAGVASFPIRLTTHTALRPGGIIRQVAMGAGTDRRFPNTEEVFPEETLPGLEDGGDFISAFTVFEHNTVVERAGPVSGGRELLGAAVTKSIDGQDLGYWRYQAEAFRYFTVYPRRVLAFHLFGRVTDRRGDDEAPFFDLPELGGSNTLRAYFEHRFRDRDAVLAAAEYRWELTRGLESVLFIEEGNVFTDVDREFRFERLRTSYGGGLRLKNQGGTAIRFELAYSPEVGSRFFFKLGPSFGQIFYEE